MLLKNLGCALVHTSKQQSRPVPQRNPLIPQNSNVKTIRGFCLLPSSTLGNKWPDPHEESKLCVEVRSTISCCCHSACYTSSTDGWHAVSQGAVIAAEDWIPEALSFFCCPCGMAGIHVPALSWAQTKSVPKGLITFPPHWCALSQGY